MTTACYSVSNVLMKAIAFPLWCAIDSRWNRNTVSAMSPVTAVMHLRSSFMSLTESWFHVPADSTATGKKCEWWTGHHIWLFCRSMLYCQLHLILWQCGLGAIGEGVWDCYILCNGFATRPRYQCGAIRMLAILLHQTNGLFDCRYLGLFDHHAHVVCLIIIVINYYYYLFLVTRVACGRLLHSLLEHDNFLKICHHLAKAPFSWLVVEIHLCVYVCVFLITGKWEKRERSCLRWLVL